MKRLTWIELGALGLLAIFALYIGANYGAFGALLVLVLTFMTLRCFIADHQVDDLVEGLRADVEKARNQRDDAVAQRMRDAIRAGRWS